MILRLFSQYLPARWLVITLLLLASHLTMAETPPFSVNTNLYKQENGKFDNLQPVDARHFTVFRGTKEAAYNHGAVLHGFKDRLFCQWQSSQKDEDGPDTHVVYSISEDGEHWSQLYLLAPQRVNAIVTSGGWWTDGKTLVAYINVWPKDLQPKSGHVEYATSEDGASWTAFSPLTDKLGKPVKGIIEQDVDATHSGRLLTTVHQQPGLVATPWYTDDPLGIRGWQPASFVNLPFAGTMSRELEPSWFVNGDGHIVMTFRDQGGSFNVLAAKSTDDGETWSSVTETSMPDSRAKQSAGNLPDGSAFIVNNPTGTKKRLPLVLSVSQDGKHFDEAYMLRGEKSLPPMRFEGKYKREGYSYPKSVMWRGSLWISYGVNKEDIAVTRVNPTMHHDQ